MAEDKLENAGMATPRTVRSGPPSGFSKGVNDYLNHYVSIADAKAGAVSVGALATAAFVLQLQRPAGWVGWLHAGCVLLMLLATGTAIAVLFPRLPGSGQGAIFWEDIRLRSSPDAYWDVVSQLDASKVEREYANQNFYVSSVLHRKHVLVRCAMGLLLAGCGAALALLLVR